MTLLRRLWCFRRSYCLNRKGMEMWQLLVMLIGILLLITLLAWSGVLGDSIGELLDKFGGLLG